MNEVKNPKYIRKEYPAFIDREDGPVKYYEKKFQRMKDRNTMISFNLWGLVFAEFWCIYRKMYGIGLVTLFVHLGAMCVAMIYDIPLLAQVTSAVFAIGFGLFGNYLYMNYADNCIMKASVMSYEERQKYYEDNGGCSWRILFGAIASLLVVMFAVAVSIAG